MSDTHEPPPADLPASPHRRRWSAGRPIIEVLLIALGVFLGLAGEQWRSKEERRAHAVAAVQRFRDEIVANRKAVAAVKEYHVATKQRLRDYFTLEPAARKANTIQLSGVQPVTFEHTAWDLAIATQSLADLDRDLAYGLARVYGQQQTYMELTRGLLQAMYLRPLAENPAGFLASLDTYYGDIVLIEPALEQMYEALLPQIDRALAR